MSLHPVKLLNSWKGKKSTLKNMPIRYRSASPTLDDSDDGELDELDIISPLQTSSPTLDDSDNEFDISDSVVINLSPSSGSSSGKKKTRRKPHPIMCLPELNYSDADSEKEEQQCPNCGVKLRCEPNSLMYRIYVIDIRSDPSKY